MAKGDTAVNIYGYNFDYDPLAGDHEGGQLTGFWQGDVPFSIDMVYDDPMGAQTIDTWSHITLHDIPEPATISLLILGTLLIRRKTHLLN